jgi:hypothetical protein
VRSAGSDVNKYLNGLRRRDCEVIMRNGHWLIRYQGQFLARAAASPSDTNALRQIQRKIARRLAELGLTLPEAS